MKIENWVRLSIAFNASCSRIHKYIDFDNAEQSLNKLLSSNTLQAEKYARVYKAVSSEQLYSVFSACQMNNINIITPESSSYPTKLRELADPPAVLYAVGDLSVTEENNCIAVIGARNCSEYSLVAADRFSWRMAKEGITIISGMAKGADQAAHIGALNANGKTVALLGCGLLYDYPRGSMNIKRAIAENGAVVSEYLPGAVPAKYYFKQRNRLITGLSDGVLVVQAAEKSGSLNSAYHAIEQGRELFVLPPHDVFDPEYFGQAALLADGARLALSPEDIIGYMKK